MSNENTQEIVIDELSFIDAGLRIKQILETVKTVQTELCKYANSEDSAQLNLLKIGTVFQLFLIDTLASGKRQQDLTKDDWNAIASKVWQYAVLEDGQLYSEFVFKLYAEYIDLSVLTLEGKARKENLEAIKEISYQIKVNTERLDAGEISEVSYIEDCLWLSLEAMIKLLASYFAVPLFVEEYALLAQSAAQFAFEYGRYVLYAREQAILEEYVRNQHVLDEQLKNDYEAYLKEVRVQSEKFQQLLDQAFSADIHQALQQSAELAREAGVKEEELLTSVEDVDAFFMD